MGVRLVRKREWNILMTAASLLGGMVGFAAGEVLLEFGEARIHETLLMGAYFGQFALWVGLACLIAETLSPGLNGRGWRSKYCRESWKLLVPATLVLLFAAGVIFQFLYGLGSGSRTVPQDYVLAIDTSGSMEKTDPDRQSLQAAKALISNLDADKRVAILLFNDTPQLLLPMTAVQNEEARNNAASRLNEAGMPDRGTDIGSALTAVSRHLDETVLPDRKRAVILISDGHSEVDLDKTLSPYRKQDVVIYTIGVQMDSDEGTRLLKRIANRTGGRFYSVENAEEVAGVFSSIYKNDDKRHLVGERPGPTSGNILYIFMRILFITGIGGLLGLSLGIIFDNRHLAWRFAWGGAAAGMIAGILLEFGLREAVEPALYRCAADFILALVIVLAPIAVPVHPEDRPTPEWDGMLRDRISGRGFAADKDKTTREFR
jgi:Ca-activated chloride channel homolog